MSLNPEMVANILQIEMNAWCLGDWYEDGRIPIAIEQEARERTTSPDSLVDWLITQHFFHLSADIDLDTFKTNLIEKLREADQSVIPDDVRTKNHRIIFIESSELQAKLFKSIVKQSAVNLYNIPARHIKYEHMTYPPAGSELIALLNQCTGAVLHNLNPKDLSDISQAVAENPVLAHRLVVVMVGGSITSEHAKHYQKLKEQGVMVIPKPFPNIQNVVKVILGMI